MSVIEIFFDRLIRHAPAGKGRTIVCRSSFILHFYRTRPRIIDLFSQAR